MSKVIIQQVESCSNCPFVRREKLLDDDGQEYITYACVAPGFPHEVVVADENDYTIEDYFYSSHDDADNNGFDIYKQIHPNCPLPNYYSLPHKDGE